MRWRKEHRGNTYIRTWCWVRRYTDGAGQSAGSKIATHAGTWQCQDWLRYATAAVILELHPTDPTLPRLSTETTRTRFALWTWVGHAPASADSHRGNENLSCHVACGTEFRCASMTVASTKVTTCETTARSLHGVPAWVMNAARATGSCVCTCRSRWRCAFYE